MISEEILKTRSGGQGKKGAKVPVVFPKLVFLYDNELHGEGKELEGLYHQAIDCTRVCQYPDYLSLDEGYLGQVWKDWGKIISPMGRIKKETAHLKLCEPRNLGCLNNIQANGEGLMECTTIKVIPC